MAEIRDVTANRKWRYCPTSENPADLLTRGITVKQLKLSILWTTGPEWLPTPLLWPPWDEKEAVSLAAMLHDNSDNHVLFTPNVSYENAKVGVHNVIDTLRYSSFTKLLRVTAYVMRFLSKLQNRQHQQTVRSSYLRGAT